MALGALRGGQGLLEEGRRRVREETSLLDDLGLVPKSGGEVGNWVDALCETPEQMERELRAAYQTLSEAGASDDVARR